MALQRAELSRGAERNRATADDDQYGIAGLRHGSSSALRIGRIDVPNPGAVFDGPPACLPARGNRARGDRYLAVTAGNIEDVGRLAQPRDAAAERANQTLASRDTGTEMRGAPGEIGMMKVVRLDPHSDETPKQGLQHGGIVVDAAQQDGLRQERDACATEPGQRLSRSRGQFARVVRM